MLRQGKGLSAAATSLEAEPKPAPLCPLLPSLGAASLDQRCPHLPVSESTSGRVSELVCTLETTFVSVFPVMLEAASWAMGPVEEEWTQEKTSVISSFPVQWVMC